MSNKTITRRDLPLRVATWADAAALLVHAVPPQLEHLNSFARAFCFEKYEQVPSPLDDAIRSLESALTLLQECRAEIDRIVTDEVQECRNRDYREEQARARMDEQQ